MGSWWNPMTWIKALTFLKSLFDSAKSLYDAYLKRKAEEAREAEIAKIEAATKKIEEANALEDEDARIKAKAEAAKALEDSLNDLRS